MSRPTSSSWLCPREEWMWGVQELAVCPALSLECQVDIQANKYNEQPQSKAVGHTHDLHTRQIPSATQSLPQPAASKSFKLKSNTVLESKGPRSIFIICVCSQSSIHPWVCPVLSSLRCHGCALDVPGVYGSFLLLGFCLLVPGIVLLATHT